MLKDTVEISNNANPPPTPPQTHTHLHSNLNWEGGGGLGRGRGDFCFVFHPFSVMTWLTPLCSSLQFDDDEAGIRPLMGVSAGLGAGM